MTWRRFANLFRELGDDSRVVRVLTDKARDVPPPLQPRRRGKPDEPPDMPTVRWGQLETLVADVRDAVHDLAHLMLTIAYAERGEKPPKPKPKPPRPTDLRKHARQAAEQAQTADLVARYERLKARKMAPREG